MLWVPQCWLVVEALAHAPQPSRWVKLDGTGPYLDINVTTRLPDIQSFSLLHRLLTQTAQQWKIKG
ncbi:unnamed protein product [Fusarium graminearum]|nr:unnamed protein product [Fusarium graminearum]